MATVDATIEQTPVTRQPRELAGKYLIFAVGDEEYGAPVLSVREIIKLLDITTVPQVPAHIKGVINLRGKVIPVSDIRVRFGFPERTYDEHTCIVVVEAQIGASRTLMGLVVDAVAEVVNIGVDDIEATPDFGAHIHTEFLQGIAKIKGHVKLLLDLDRVCGGDGRR